MDTMQTRHNDMTHNRIRYVLTGRRVRGVWSVYVRDQYGARSGEGATLGEAMIAAGVML